MELVEKVKKQRLFTLNRTQYFGTVTATEGADGKVEVSEAVKVTSDNFGDTVKSWIKADNSGVLKSPKSSGLYTLEEEELTEDQLMIVEIICSRTAYIKKHVLRDLQNKAISNIDVE